MVLEVEVLQEEGAAVTEVAVVVAEVGTALVQQPHSCRLERLIRLLKAK